MQRLEVDGVFVKIFAARWKWRWVRIASSALSASATFLFNTLIAEGALEAIGVQWEIATNRCVPALPVLYSAPPRIGTAQQIQSAITYAKRVERALFKVGLATIQRVMHEGGKMHSGIGRLTVAIIILLLNSGSKTGLSDSNNLRRADGAAHPLPMQSSVSLQTDQPVLSEEEMRQWKTYTDNRITFRYPAKITLRKRNGRIFLTHSIRFKHLDPCDYSGDMPDLSNLIDFKVSLDKVHAIKWPVNEIVN